MKFSNVQRWDWIQNYFDGSSILVIHLFLKKNVPSVCRKARIWSSLFNSVSVPSNRTTVLYTYKLCFTQSLEHGNVTVSRHSISLLVVVYLYNSTWLCFLLYIYTISISVLEGLAACIVCTLYLVPILKSRIKNHCELNSIALCIFVTIIHC